MWFKELKELIYPPIELCPFCKKQSLSLGLPGCENCLSLLGLNCRKLTLSYTAYVLTSYNARAKELLNLVKYHNNYELALAIGQIMGLAAKEEPLLQKTDFLLPVPLHPTRLKQRGFNQALAFAEGMSQVWPRQIYRDFYRVKDTLPQSNFSPAERRLNLKNAFMFNELSKIKAKYFLIIDDIFTTGITFMTIASLINQYNGIPMGLFMTQTPTDI